MSGTDLIGYAYEAALHCVDCTVARHKAGGFRVDPTYEHAGELDENDVPYDALDSEGNPLAPIFETTELEPGDCCDDCFEPFREEDL